MNNEEKKFTHLAEIYGFRCYFNEDTNDVKGTNWFNDIMIDLFIWLDVEILQYNEVFKIKIIRKL